MQYHSKIRLFQSTQCSLHPLPQPNGAIFSTQKCFCVFFLSMFSFMILSCSLTPSRSIFLLSVNFLLQRDPYGIILWVGVWTLRRSFIFDKFWCGLLWTSLGYPACVGRCPILLKHVIVSYKHSYDVTKRLLKNDSHNFTLILHFLETLY